MDVLRQATPPEWLAVALADMNAVLLDHAHCERKAAASALSLVNDYPDQPELVRRCTKLAQEELRHFLAVVKELTRRGLVLRRDSGDPYAQKLRKHIRHDLAGHRVDRLLVSALIEARSAERLELLGTGLSGELARFYTRLAQAEAGHYQLFVDLAESVATAPHVHQRLAELAEIESQIAMSLPLEARIH